MDKEVKIRIDEMLAAIEAAPHLNLAVYAVNVCRQSLANDLHVDEEIIEDIISEYQIDEDEISSYFQQAQTALTEYQIHLDDFEFDAKFQELQEQINFNDSVMALAKCLILAAIDDHKKGYSTSDEDDIPTYDSKEEYLEGHLEEFYIWAYENNDTEGIEEDELKKIVESAILEQLDFYTNDETGKVYLNDYSDILEQDILADIENKIDSYFDSDN